MRVEGQTKTLQFILVLIGPTAQAHTSAFTNYFTKDMEKSPKQLGKEISPPPNNIYN